MIKQKHIFFNNTNSTQEQSIDLHFGNRSSNTSLIIHSNGDASSAVFHVLGRVSEDDDFLLLELMEVNNLSNGLIENATLGGVYEVINAESFGIIRVVLTDLQEGNINVVGEVIE